ncbi:aldo/keto reductase [Alsobacter sp. SYSU M60028]|uniref:Aldo/keto reductase n=1 Tax=Alsobacter ponti TaxID=2962936 RepID=A0ABT1L822_9HYPH|nr:aldo/keto reductase [Alsobacter ponti]MCP8937650.1 aldo/keto reductase [Alsobacter ponti]
MKSRKFTTRAGATLDVSEMGLGAAPLGDLFEILDERTVFETLTAAHEVGVTLFDTSPHYGNGLAEARCGAALRGLPRDSFVFSTKVGRVMDPFKPPAPKNPDVYSPGFAGGFPHGARFDYSYDGTMRSVEHSLLRTGFSRIDILLIHDVDVWTHGDDYERRFGEAMGGAYKALDELRRTGFVKAIGVGVNESEVATRFATEGDFDTVLLAGRYSLLEQPALETFLPLAVRKGIGVMLGGVFNSGILATGSIPGAKYNYAAAPEDVMRTVRRIENVCARHGVPLRRAALAFALAHPAVISVVIGAVKPAEPRANAADLAQPIPAALWSDLKAEGLLAADAAVPA